MYLTGVYVLPAEGYYPAVWRVALDGTETRTDLTRPIDVWYVSIGGVMVNGADVYVAGSVGLPSMGDDGTVVCYWLNGERTDLETAEYGNAKSIVVTGDQVVVTGHTAQWENSMPENYLAKVWSGGSSVVLDAPDSGVTTASLSGENLVVVGYSTDVETNDKVGTIWVIPGVPSSLSPASVWTMSPTFFRHTPETDAYRIREFLSVMLR